jgi:carboxypeptidase family protein
MRNIFVFVLVAATSLPAAPLLASQLTGSAAQAQPVIVGRTVVSAAQAQISGTVVTPAGEPMANAVVRARNLLTGDIGGSTSTATRGEFAIAVIPGSYMLEIVDPGGQIVGTSSFISAAAGTAVTAMVTASTGMLSAAAGATGLIATLGATAARSVAFAAAAAGVAGVVTPQNTPTASPSR